MSFGKRKDGRAYPKRKKSGTKKSGSTKVNEGQHIKKKGKSKDIHVVDFTEQEKELDRQEDELMFNIGQEKEWTDDLAATEKSQAEFKAFFAKNKITKPDRPDQSLNAELRKKLK